MACPHHADVGCIGNRHDVCEDTHAVLHDAIPAGDGGGWLFSRRSLLSRAVISAYDAGQGCESTLSRTSSWIGRHGRSGRRTSEPSGKTWTCRLAMALPYGHGPQRRFMIPVIFCRLVAKGTRERRIAPASSHVVASGVPRRWRRWKVMGYWNYLVVGAGPRVPLCLVRFLHT